MINGFYIAPFLSRFEGEVKSYRVYQDDAGYFLFPQARHFLSLDNLFTYYSQNRMVPGDNDIGPVLRKAMDRPGH